MDLAQGQRWVGLERGVPKMAVRCRALLQCKTAWPGPSCLPTEEVLSVLLIQAALWAAVIVGSLTQHWK